MAGLLDDRPAPLAGVRVLELGEDRGEGCGRLLSDLGADVVKIMATGGRTTPGSNPELPQYPAEHLHAAVEQAHALGRRLTAHVHGVEGIRNAVAAGVDGLFLECHPEPAKSQSDAATMMKLSDVEDVLSSCNEIWKLRGRWT